MEYTCVLGISNNVQWYRSGRDTSNIVAVNQRGRDINYQTHSNGNTVLSVTNAQVSYNGFVWVQVGFGTTYCNASLIVRPGTYVNIDF